MMVIRSFVAQLFDFLASCIARFLEEHRLKDADLPMGFVFSYPCLLSSIRSATLLWWTKGFKVSHIGDYWRSLTCPSPPPPTSSEKPSW